MVKQLHVEGHGALKEALEANKDSVVFVLLSGSLGEDGKSWCPDCVTGKVGGVELGWKSKSPPFSRSVCPFI